MIAPSSQARMTGKGLFFGFRYEYPKRVPPRLGGHSRRGGGTLVSLDMFSFPVGKVVKPKHRACHANFTTSVGFCLDRVGRWV